MMLGKSRKRGQKKQWLDDNARWSGKSLAVMVHLAEDMRDGYRRFIHEVAYASLPRHSNIPAVWKYCIEGFCVGGACRSEGFVVVVLCVPRVLPDMVSGHFATLVRSAQSHTSALRATELMRNNWTRMSSGRYSNSWKVIVWPDVNGTKTMRLN